MKNIDKLLSTIDEKNHCSLNGKTLSIRAKVLTGKEVYKLFESIKWLNNRFALKRFVVNVKSYRFASSDVVSVIELLMLYLSANFPNLWTFNFEYKGFENNALYRYSLLPFANNKSLGKSYEKQFNNRTITLNHFRAVISLEEFLNDNKSISAYCDDIYNFLKHAGIEEVLCCDLFEACSEVISNVFDHTETDCLVDIKLSPVKSGSTLFTFNVISLSHVYIGTKIIELFSNGELVNYSGYNIVRKAFEYHKDYFSESYDLDSFGFVCAFQKRVSTRKNSSQSGGTGFTTLLKKIHGKKSPEEYYSYVISGRNTLYFKNDYLNVGSDGLIGFNDNNDFYLSIPNMNIVKKENNIFPGTIFSISLLL